MIKGRRAIILPPTKPEQAPARKEARKADRLAQKEKWSHLLRMGTITEEKNKWEWNKLNKAEQNLRTSSAKQRKFQINDPNFAVNPLRLSIRNLPVFVDSSVVQKALKAQKINHRKVIVIRSKDRKDQNGVRRSLGYAFAEFDDHESALEALKFLNCNRSAVPGEKGLIVEFAMEDKRKLHLQEKSKEYFKKKLAENLEKQNEAKENKFGKEEKKQGDTAAKNVEGVKKKCKQNKKRNEGRGKLQREKRRLRKQEEAEDAKILEKADSKLAKQRAREEKRKRENVDHEMERALTDSKPKKQKKKAKGELDDDFESKLMSKWRA